MEMYKGETVRSSMSARIHPTDATIPDCICILLLTDSHLFIIEDNFDGSYTDHYVIKTGLIEDIRLSVPETNGDTPAAGSAADMRKGWNARIFRQRASGRLRSSAAPKKYLEVIYIDEDRVRQHLFFDECDERTKGFLNSFSSR